MSSLSTKKQKTHRCEKCDFKSENKSEFITCAESPSSPHEHAYSEDKIVPRTIVVCLGCVSMSNLREQLNSVQIKMGQKIEERKLRMKNGENEEATVLDFKKQLILKQEDIVYPKDIKELLNRRIIGQEHAKNKIAVAVANHLHKIKNPNLSIQKSNVLLMGPTGTGKTEMFRTLANDLSLPFVSASATNITASGYVGRDASDILVNLIQAAENDPYLAETGIVFIDEIDKLATTSNDLSAVNTSRVQQELLRIIEGDIVQVNIGSKMQPHMIDLNTENILFICAGAFVGLKEQINEHYKPMGIMSKNLGEKVPERTLLDVTPDDLKRYGLIPEFLGRLPVVASTDELTLDELSKILTEPTNSIVKQFTDLFSVYNVKVNFDPSFLKMVANQSLQNKTGARGLRSILEKHLNSVMYSIDNNFGKVLTFKACAENQSLVVDVSVVEKSFSEPVHDSMISSPESMVI